MVRLDIFLGARFFSFGGRSQPGSLGRYRRGAIRLERPSGLRLLKLEIEGRSLSASESNPRPQIQIRQVAGYNSWAGAAAVLERIIHVWGRLTDSPAPSPPPSTLS